MTRKICVVTGSRAEYGLLYWILREIQKSPSLELQLVVTGMHLSSEFGMTVREIEKDGFEITHSVEMLLSSDSSVGVAKSVGLGIAGFADAFKNLNPDLLLVLGDRFEILSAVISAFIAAIPVAHIHGGEVTEGAFDDGIRHSITKMSSLHFASAEAYRNRILQLGENPTHVFNVGAPGVEHIERLELMDKGTLQQIVGLDLTNPTVLVTFHPETLKLKSAGRDFKNLLSALDGMEHLQIIVTKSNADTEGREINRLIEEFVESRPHAVAYTSLGQKAYLSLLKHVVCVIGNSSSGIIEAPSLKTGTVNIGNRQKGRIRASSVFDCEPEVDAIKKTVCLLMTQDIQNKIRHTTNPHGGGKVSQRITEILSDVSLNNLHQKQFHDL